MRLRGLVPSLFPPFFALAHPLEWHPSHTPAGRDFFGLLGNDVLPTTSTTLENESPATSSSTSLSSSSSPSLSGTMETGSRITPSFTISLTVLGDSLTTTATDWTTTSAMFPTVSVEYVPEAPATPAGEATEWKVIGISIIAVTFVATVILAIAFFDSWWGFLRDVIFGKRYNEGEENLIPDWEKRSWEYKLASEDGHRYPTITSLENIVAHSEEHSEKIRPRSEAMILPP